MVANSDQRPGPEDCQPLSCMLDFIVIVRDCVCVCVCVCVREIERERERERESTRVMQTLFGHNISPVSV